jgi:hypothetical protein
MEKWKNGKVENLEHPIDYQPLEKFTDFLTKKAYFSFGRDVYFLYLCSRSCLCGAEHENLS